MNCEWVRENIVLHVYHELEDDARHELEQHLARCADCAAELKSAKELHAALSEAPMSEPSPNLLAASRMRFQEALETAEQASLWRRLVFDPSIWLRQVKFSPALASAILILGFAGGVGTAYRVLVRPAPGPTASPAQPAAEASITGIRSITQEPGSNQINIKYDTVATEETHGSLNDQRIQQLLLFAARNNYNSGVRMDSVELLTQKPSDPQIREELIYALQNDSNPGVRLKALDGLSSFVRQDPRVRDGVLRALISDTSSGVRLQALRLVEPMKTDSNVRSVLTKLSQTDQNVSIRSQARTMLAQMPEMD